MADVTVAQFAEVLKVPVEKLLTQLDEAGIKVSGSDDKISDDAKLGLGVRRVRDDEFWVDGHIPGRPLLRCFRIPRGWSCGVPALGFVRLPVVAIGCRSGKSRGWS